MENSEMKKALQYLLEEEANDTEILNGLAGLHINDVPHRDLMDIARRKLKREIHAWAQSVADKHMTTHWRYRKGDGVKKQYGKVCVRVKMREWTIYVEWYEQSYYLKNGEPRPHSKTYTLPPSTGKSTRVRMPMSKFSKAWDWEKKSIEEAENEFARIRRCANYLKEIDGALSGVYQLLEMQTVPEYGDIDPELLENSEDYDQDYDHDHAEEYAHE